MSLYTQYIKLANAGAFKSAQAEGMYSPHSPVNDLLQSVLNKGKSPNFPYFNPVDLKNPIPSGGFGISPNKLPDVSAAPIRVNPGYGSVLAQGSVPSGMGAKLPQPEGIADMDPKPFNLGQLLYSLFPGNTSPPKDYQLTGWQPYGQ